MLTLLTFLTQPSARGHPLPQNLGNLVKFLPQQAARKRDAAWEGSGGGFNSHWTDMVQGQGQTRVIDPDLTLTPEHSRRLPLLDVIQAASLWIGK
jgi:hypothetical protein